MEIRTIEALDKDNRLPLPLPTSSVDADKDGKTTAAAHAVNSVAYTIAASNGTQCGYCTPGFTVSLSAAKESLAKKKFEKKCEGLCEEEVFHDIEELYAGHICRCTGYRGLRLAAKSILLDYEKSEEMKDTPSMVLDANQQSYIHDLGENSFKCELKLAHDTGMKNDLVHVWDVNADLPQKPYPKPTALTPAVSSPVPPPAATHHVSLMATSLLPSAETLSPVHADETKKKTWFTVEKIGDVKDLLRSAQEKRKNIKLVFGNTSAGIYKDQEWQTVDWFVNMNRLEELQFQPHIQMNDKIPELVIPLGCSINSLKEFIQDHQRKPEHGEHHRHYEEFRVIASLLHRVAGHQIRNAGTVFGSVTMAVKHHFTSDTFLALATCGGRAEVHVLQPDRRWELQDRHLFNLYDHPSLGLLDLTADSKFIITKITVALHPETKNITGEKSLPSPFLQTYKVSRRLQMAHSLVNLGCRVETLSGAKHPQALFLVGGISSSYVTLKKTAQEVNKLLQKDYGDAKEDLSSDIQTILQNTTLPELNGLVKSTDEEDPQTSRVVLATNLVRRFLFLFCSRYYGLQLADEESMCYNTFHEKLIHDSKGKQSFSVNNTEFPVTEPMVKTTAVKQATGEQIFTRTMDPPENCVHATFVLSSQATGQIIWNDETISKLPRLLADHLKDRFGVDISESHIHFYTAKNLGAGNCLTSSFSAYQQFKEYLLADLEVVFYGQPIGIIVTNHQWATEYLATLLSSPEAQDSSNPTAILSFKSTYKPFLNLEDDQLPKGNPEVPILSRDGDGHSTKTSSFPRKFNTESAPGKFAAINWISNFNTTDKPPTFDWEQYNNKAKFVNVEGTHYVGSQIHMYMETQSAIAFPPKEEKKEGLLKHATTAVMSTLFHLETTNDNKMDVHELSNKTTSGKGQIMSKFLNYGQHYRRPVHGRQTSPLEEETAVNKSLVSTSAAIAESVPEFKSGEVSSTSVPAAAGVAAAVSPPPTTVHSIPSVLRTMQVYSSTQSSNTLAKGCSTLLQAVRNNQTPPPANSGPTYNYSVQILIPPVGGGFGGKEPQSKYVTLAAAFVADQLNVPCRVVLDRNTDMTMIGKRHAFRGDYKLAVDIHTGKIEAMYIRYYSDAGYCYDASLPIMDLAVLSSFNSYNAQKFLCEGDCYFTNKATSTAMRSFGVIQANQITEAAIGHLAYAFAQARKEKNPSFCQYKFRLDNFFPWHPESTPDSQLPITPFGQPIRSCNSKGVWYSLSRRVLEYVQKRKRAEQLSDIGEKVMREPTKSFEILEHQIQEFNEKHKFVKQGFAVLPLMYGISFTFIPMNSMFAQMTIDPHTNIVTIQSLGIEMGQGLQTKLLQIASVSLGIRPHYIRIQTLDPASDNTKVSSLPGTGASTGTDLNGRAIKALQPVLNAAVQKLASSAQLMDYWNEHHSWYDARSAHPTEDHWPTVVALLAANKQLQFEAQYNMNDLLVQIDQSMKKGSPFYYFNYAAAFVHTQLDCLTGEWRILHSDFIFDAGISINPAIDIGQIEGGFVQGTGFVTSEEVRFNADSGKLLTNSTWSYKPPMSTDIPEEFNTFLYPCDPTDLQLLEDNQKEGLRKLFTDKQEELRHLVAFESTEGDSFRDMQRSFAKLMDDSRGFQGLVKLLSKRHFSIDMQQMVDSFGIQSSKTTGEPPLVLGNTVFFALQDTIRRYHQQTYGYELTAGELATVLKCPATTYSLIDALQPIHPVVVAPTVNSPSKK
jgi:xanthine dehydrogenase molybdopterin-binding subunit B/aerobic-type carbon monoxide dehydrogenase small subunit (CoxS/CutS family)